MSDNYHNDFDRAVREKLGDYRAPYNPDDWSAMQEQLDGAGRKRGGYLLPVLLLLLVGAGVTGWALFGPGFGSGQDSGMAQSELAAPGDQSGNQPEQEFHGKDAGPLPPDSEQNAEARTPVSEDLDAGYRNSGQQSPELAAASLYETASQQGIANQLATPSQPAGVSTLDRNSGDESRLSETQDSQSESVDANAQSTDSDQEFEQASSQESFAFGMTARRPEGLTARLENSAEFNTVSGMTEVPEAFPVPLSSATLSSTYLTPGDYDRNNLGSPEGGNTLRLVLSPSVGLNSTHTTANDGFSPGWDAGFALEMQFGKRFALTTGVRYGRYAFEQSRIDCGDPAADGLNSEVVNCPARLDGEIGTMEVPVRFDYIIPTKKAPGNFRVFAGLTGQYRNTQHYEVRFEDFQAGDVLYFPPTILEVANNVGVATYTLSIDDNSDVSTLTLPDERNDEFVSRRFTAAGEIGFGYEQFLSDVVSLGIEPRLTVPFTKLEINDRRNATIGVNARMRVYLGGR